MELEEKIKVLQEEFKDLPKVLIKRTLCGVDVNEDLAKATDRLREMKTVVPLFNNGNPANRVTEELKDSLYAHPAAGRDKKANSWVEEGDTLYTETPPTSVHSTPSSLYSKQNLRSSYGDFVPSMRDDAFVRGLQAALSGRSSPSQLDNTGRHSSSFNSHPTELAAETENLACGMRCNDLSFASGRKILTENMMNSTKRVNGTVAPCPPKTKPKPKRRKQSELDGDCKESRESPPPPTPSHVLRSLDTPPQPPHAPPAPPPPPPLPQVHVPKPSHTSPQPPLPRGNVSQSSCVSPPIPFSQPTASISRGGLKLSSSSPFVRNCLDRQNVNNDLGKDNDATLKVSEDTNNKNNNVQEDQMELEEKVEKLKKEFSSLPKILIKKTLRGDDVDGDITKARQRLQEFNRQFNDSAPIKNPSQYLNSSPVLRPDNNTRNHFEEQERGNRLPRNWTPMPRDDKGNDIAVHLAKLESSSAEYQDVVERFQQTVSSSMMIKSIERIQNPFLYQSYQLRKLKMDRDNEGDNERQLFHGTNSVNVTKINTQGFDRSFSGYANGALYGSGVYFARDASYSVNYTGGSCRVMYLARVLVGKYCQGKQNMRKPPPINPEQPEILFDSLVNKLDDPSIFVVYYDNQCYPEYLITIQ